MENQLGENMGPLEHPDQAMFQVGDRVTLDDDHELYPGESGEIKARGWGIGFYAGNVVYDVLLDDAADTERVTEDQIAG